MNDPAGRNGWTDPTPGSIGRADWGGVVRTRVSQKYLYVLFVAWVLFGIALLLPSMALDNPPSRANPGYEVFFFAGIFCITAFGQITVAAWIGTLSNVVLLILSPIFHRGGKGAGKEKFFNLVALISGLWVWTIPALLYGMGQGSGSPFLIGYYVWALAHVLVGTRIFWPREWYNNRGPVPPCTRTGPKPRPPHDDWPKDQTGDWDEAGDKSSGRRKRT